MQNNKSIYPCRILTTEYIALGEHFPSAERSEHAAETMAQTIQRSPSVLSLDLAIRPP